LFPLNRSLVANGNPTYPFYGSRRMAVVLRDDGWLVNRKRAQRLMRVMGLEAIYQKPNTSQPQPDHKVYPNPAEPEPIGLL
jgi:HTH-like domain